MPYEYVVLDRPAFVATMLQHTPSGAVLTLEGALPEQAAIDLEPFRVGSRGFFSKEHRYHVDEGSALALEAVIRKWDETLASSLSGLRLDHDGTSLVEARHLYDYGAPPDAGRSVFVSDAVPRVMRWKWEIRDEVMPAAV